MSTFTNLGDLIGRDRDGGKTAVIDLGGEDVPTEYCFAELDGMTMAVARALSCASPSFPFTVNCPE